MNIPATDESSLIARWIVVLPSRPDLAEARIRDYGVPVWALIGYLPAVHGDLSRTAGDYGLPIEALLAAVAYYRRHQHLIDARLAANDPPDDLCL